MLPRHSSVQISVSSESAIQDINMEAVVGRSANAMKDQAVGWVLTRDEDVVQHYEKADRSENVIDSNPTESTDKSTSTQRHTGDTDFSGTSSAPNSHRSSLASSTASLAQMPTEWSDPSFLPHVTSPSISLVHPTAEEQYEQTNVNGASWRGALSIESYHRREAHLAAQDATRDGGIGHWVLVHDRGDGSRKILCGCETYRKRALIARRGSVHESFVQGIGSVFTPESNRGKGYANRMMTLLADGLTDAHHDRFGDDADTFSVLYSDIGKVRLGGMLG